MGPLSGLSDFSSFQAVPNLHSSDQTRNVLFYCHHSRGTQGHKQKLQIPKKEGGNVVIRNKTVGGGQLEKK